MCETSVVVVVSPTKLSDEVTGPPVSHWLDPADSQTDPTVPQSLSNSESVTRPQTSSHDEPYELLQSERPFYSAAPPRPPLPSQPPSGMPSGGLLCVYCRRFPYRTDAITLKSISLYYTWCNFGHCSRCASTTIWFTTSLFTGLRSWSTWKDVRRQLRSSTTDWWDWWQSEET